ncbi:hypothetical protein [Vibrio phage BONAISHI]|nr:hypothetical protein [Vibrio phage BONAISHI]
MPLFEKAPEVTYIDIRARINAMGGTPFIAHLNADMLKALQGKIKEYSINELLANPEASNRQIGDLESWLITNRMQTTMMRILDKIIGTCINTPAEYDIFISGLATNALAYGTKGHANAMEYYRTHPEFIVLRLMETLEFSRKVNNG